VKLAEMEVGLQILKAANQVVFDILWVEDAVFVLGAHAQKSAKASSKPRINVDLRVQGRGNKLEGTIHVVDVYSSQVARKLGGGEQLQFLEEFVLRLISAIIAGSINEKSKWPVPEPARDLNDVNIKS
jgi:hypothetical protein